MAFTSSRWTTIEYFHPTMVWTLYRAVQASESGTPSSGAAFNPLSIRTTEEH